MACCADIHNTSVTALERNPWEMQRAASFSPSECVGGGEEVGLRQGGTGRGGGGQMRGSERMVEGGGDRFTRRDEKEEKQALLTDLRRFEYVPSNFS